MTTPETTTRPKVLTRDMLMPFMLVAILFPLWGFANDLTNPLVKAFKDIFLISNTQSSMVQFAFYLGYGIMAIPAAIFIRSYSYKSGILLGLGLYAIGASLFIPASIYQEFYFYLLKSTKDLLHSKEGEDIQEVRINKMVVHFYNLL